MPTHLTRHGYGYFCIPSSQIVLLASRTQFWDLIYNPASATTYQRWDWHVFPKTSFEIRAARLHHLNNFSNLDMWKKKTALFQANALRDFLCYLLPNLAWKSTISPISSLVDNFAYLLRPFLHCKCPIWEIVNIFHAYRIEAWVDCSLKSASR